MWVKSGEGNSFCPAGHISKTFSQRGPVLVHNIRVKLSEKEVFAFHFLKKQLFYMI
jgi:hypothetical protein